MILRRRFCSANACEQKLGENRYSAVIKVVANACELKVRRKSHTRVIKGGVLFFTRYKLKST